jgi:hypothetical protein
MEYHHINFKKHIYNRNYNMFVEELTKIHPNYKIYYHNYLVKTIFLFALRTNNYDIVGYGLNNEYLDLSDIDEYLRKSIRNNYVGFIYWCHYMNVNIKNICVYAVHFNNKNIFQWAFYNGYTFDEPENSYIGHEYTHALHDGNIQMVYLMHDLGFQFGTDFYIDAIESCATDEVVIAMCEFAYINECELTEEVCKYASEYGRFHVLEWLIGVNCPIDAYAYWACDKVLFPNIHNLLIEINCPKGDTKEELYEWLNKLNINVDYENTTYEQMVEEINEHYYGDD